MYVMTDEDFETTRDGIFEGINEGCLNTHHEEAIQEAKHIDMSVEELEGKNRCKAV